MISLAKLKRLDISAHNPKMFSKPSHGRLNSPHDVNLKSSPADVQVSARNRPLVNCQNQCSRPVGCGAFGQCFLARYRNITAIVLRKWKDGIALSRRVKDASLRCFTRIIYCIASVIMQASFSFRHIHRTGIQFHGCGEESLTLHKEIKRRLLNETSTLGTFNDICGTLENISAATWDPTMFYSKQKRMDFARLLSILEKAVQ